MKKNNGITLIALVVTIIVLLILAGVSLNLVTGSNGILGKAKTSVDKTKEESAKEQVELKMAEYQTEFKEAVYVNHEVDVNKTMGEWLLEKKSGEQSTEDYKFEITKDGEQYKVTILQDKTLKEDIVGTVTKDGAIVWIEAGNGENSGGNTPEEPETPKYSTLFSQIDAINYGEYVNLETSYVKGKTLDISSTETETATEDWRIFHKDTNGTWLILADYLPYSYETTVETGLTQYNTNYPYNWISKNSRKDLLTKLGNKTAWNKLLSSQYTEKGIEAIGAIDIETWVASWNAEGYTTLYINMYSNVNGITQKDGLDGYYIGKSENPMSTSIEVEYLDNKKGYRNTLYFPHKEAVSNNTAYWLASPAAQSDGCVIYVKCDSDVGSRGMSTFVMSVRPAVYLPSNILAEKNAEGVWEIK